RRRGAAEGRLAGIEARRLRTEQGVVQDRAPRRADRYLGRGCHGIEGAGDALVVGEIEGDRLRRLVVFEFVAEQIVEHDQIVRLSGTRRLDAGLDELGAARGDVAVWKLHERPEQTSLVAVDQDVELQRLAAFGRGRRGAGPQAEHRKNGNRERLANVAGAWTRFHLDGIVLAPISGLAFGFD